MKKRITKVTTKTGDKGTTGMADGERVSKSDPRIESIGEIDELNSLIGYLDSITNSSKYKPTFNRIQNCLFDIGGSLSMGTNSAIDEEEIEFLEEQLNLFNEELPDLKNFILPGGATASAMAQLARSVCRRCERSLVSLNEKNIIEENKLIYINRLSDLLFVIARSINKEMGIEELLWKQN